jgi:hypothetical protein
MIAEMARMENIGNSVDDLLLKFTIVELFLLLVRMVEISQITISYAFQSLIY